jgi:(R,R)-butanediol dehydrogenase/meso-butanediol dehydrogenase/diacetyl reductase
MSNLAWTWQAGAYHPSSIDGPPAAAPGRAVVRVHQVGVCGSDLLHIVEGVEEGQCFGHEWFGVVENVGAGVPLNEGQWVTGSPFIGCGTCTACAAGFTNHCRSAQVLGYGPVGGLRTWLDLPADQLVMVPPDLHSIGVLLEPASVAVESGRLLEAGGPLAGRIAVIGAGPIGILIGCWLLDHGFAPVVFESISQRLAVARGLSIDVVDVADVDAMNGHTGRYAAIIDCSSALGRAGGWETVFALAARAARVVCVAKYPGGAMVEIGRLARNALTVTWMRGAPHDALHAAIAWGPKLLARKDLLGCEFLPADRLNDGLDRAMRGDSAGKVILVLP